MDTVEPRPGSQEVSGKVCCVVTVLSQAALLPLAMAVYGGGLLSLSESLCATNVTPKPSVSCHQDQGQLSDCATAPTLKGLETATISHAHPGPASTTEGLPALRLCVGLLQSQCLGEDRVTSQRPPEGQPAGEVARGGAWA